MWSGMNLPKVLVGWFMFEFGFKPLGGWHGWFFSFFFFMWYGMLWFIKEIGFQLIYIPTCSTSRYQKQNLLSFCFSFVQACPKLIDRFKEREENVKVRPDQLTGEIWALHLNPHLSLLWFRWMSSIHSLSYYVKLETLQKGRLTWMNQGKFLYCYAWKIYLILKSFIWISPGKCLGIFFLFVYRVFHFSFLSKFLGFETFLGQRHCF